MKILSIIPARGGSKGLPGKNIKELSGKPLIGWTIEAALNSSKIDRVICSTDDAQIASVAESFHCEVPFIRPNKLAQDDVPLVDVVAHAIDYLEKNGESYDAVITLQGTSPFRTSDDIDKAIEFFINRNAKSLMSLCEASTPPFWHYSINKFGYTSPVIDNEYVDERRQKIPKTYIRNGAIFINMIDTFKKWRDFFKPDPIGYIMEPTHSVDIDDIHDFLYAEFLLNQKIVNETDNSINRS